MGSRFELWLNKPSSLCSLRRVLDTTALARSAIVRDTSARLRHTTTHQDAIRDNPDQDEPSTARRRRYYRSPTTTHDTQVRVARQDKERAESALRDSLGSDVWEESGFKLRRAFPSLRREDHSLHATPQLVKYMIESPLYRLDFKLWAELLQVTRRREGMRAILLVWRGMREHSIDLPVVGDEADVLWSTFITAGIVKKYKDDTRQFLEEVLQYAARLKECSGSVYPKLYQTAVGRFLRVNPYYAASWHRYIRAHFGHEYVNLKALAVDCAANDAFKGFKAIYLEHEKRGKIYNQFIPAMLRRQGVEKTLKWHKLFLAHGDGPNAEVFALPLVQQLLELDGDKSLPMVHDRPGEGEDFVVPTDGLSIDFPSLTRATMSTLVGEVHGIKQREVSDGFVAKMFATRAFPVDMIISGLSVMGVERIGPLALRELALRSGSAADLTERLSILQRMGVQMSEAIYCQILAKFARNQADPLFEALLASDVHPEAFEDASIQDELLVNFLKKGDLINVQITLAALSLHGARRQADAWNRVLQHYIVRAQYRAVSKTTQQMQSLRIPISRSTLFLMRTRLLPHRRKAHAPPEYMLGEYSGVLPLQFTLNVHLYAAEAGTRIEARTWIEYLKRFGMLQKWDELKRLVHWLVTFYSHEPRTSRTIRLDNGKKTNRNVTLRSIFNPLMRGALIVWGFRSAVKQNLLSEAKSAPSNAKQPWARGIVLLGELDKIGLYRSDPQTISSVVKRVVLQLMWMLFGPATSEKQINVKAQARNKLPLAHYIQHANELLGGKLFDLDPELYEPRNYSKLLVELFGRRRRLGKKSGDRADVLAYARAVAEKRIMPSAIHRNGSERRRTWQQSPFRIASARTPRPPFWERRRQRRLLAARSSNSHLAPSRQDTLEAV